MLPRNIIINAWLIPSCSDALTSLSRNMMINTQRSQCVWAGGYKTVLIMFLGMAENASEQVGLSRINQSFIQSCGSALVR